MRLLPLPAPRRPGAAAPGMADEALHMLVGRSADGLVHQEDVGIGGERPGQTATVSGLVSSHSLAATS